MDSYEQKYKEALANARQEYNTTENVERKQWLEELFPELAESENERIRKAIHIYLDWLDGRNKDCQPKGEYTIRDMIAWLKKQGNPTDINPSEFDLHLNKLLKQFETLPKEELVSSLSFYLNVVQNDGTYKEEKESEQKLPIGKLPSEMKTIGESLGFTTQEECDKYNQMVTDLIMSDDGKSEQKPTDKEMKTLLRTEYEKGRADAISEMEKPTWSVEDMSKVQRICKYLDEAKKYYANITEVRECTNWLKSLKDRVQPRRRHTIFDEII